jgi:hypothetical protein
MIKTSHMSLRADGDIMTLDVAKCWETGSTFAGTLHGLAGRMVGIRLDQKGYGTVLKHNCGAEIVI